MKVYVTALVALFLVGGITLPVSARDFKADVPGWQTMSDQEKAKVIKNISRKNKLRKDQDKIIVQDPQTTFPICPIVCKIWGCDC
jgi:hypothetical protein